MQLNICREGCVRIILFFNTTFFYFRGNPKLTTSINHLLIWICCFCLLESTLGVAVKAMILQGTVSSLVDRRYISMVN